MGDAKKLLGDIFGSSDSEDDDRDREATLGSIEDDDENDAAEKGKQQFVSSLEAERSDDEGVDEEAGVHHATKAKQKNDGPPLNMEAPLLPAPGSDVEIKQFKLSNILAVQPKAFDPVSYMRGEEAFVDHQGNPSMDIIHNTIRWRWARSASGDLVKESNARFVKWSDGSQQLIIGDEVLDIAEQDTDRDQCYLYVRHPGLIQAQTKLKSKITFRPSSLNSRSHRALTAKMDQRHGKTDKLRMMLTTVDPIREKEEREKVEEQRNKDRLDLFQRQEKELERGGYSLGTGGGEHGGAGGRLASFLEQEDDGLDETEEEAMRREEDRERRIREAKRQVPEVSRKGFKHNILEEEDQEMDSDDDAPIPQRKRARNVVMDADDSD
mmetsp:Transcript_23684/g.32612  ORF Transcript_23684/g.32612 Transcript_23684/m.32612 type:complete len:381 (+) Transcript_23684:50-1192(+)|eukprot:CAMPEP_0196570958 /NCGR_PEP_ID=MMETSP1081-20130531/1126_1 /TAXON_ID=36882 /ORGANISM="Pyramimonas amylifera, Strain CCMP720" /LENGTH=380 /DNA_ID=CAMNT_0041887673 /DNA_START=37 /DNA_END=1179 /DNA_ORIENTATION=-